MGRSSKAEIEARIQVIAEAIEIGLQKRSDLLQFVSDQDWEVSERQIDNYIAEARDLLNSIRVGDLKEQRRKRIKQLEHLLQQNYESGNLKEARLCIGVISDLEGIVPSRFANRAPEEAPRLTVISRFEDKWKKASRNY